MCGSWDRGECFSAYFAANFAGKELPAESRYNRPGKQAQSLRLERSERRAAEWSAFHKQTCFSGTCATARGGEKGADYSTRALLASQHWGTLNSEQCGIACRRQSMRRKQWH